MPHTNLTALYFIEPQLWLLEVLHCGNRNFFTFFFSYDIDLDLMTFIYKLDPYSLEIHRMCKYEFLHQGFQKLSSDRQTNEQTRPKLYTTPLRGWSRRLMSIRNMKTKVTVCKQYLQPKL